MKEPGGKQNKHTHTHAASSSVLLCKASTSNSMPSWRLINELFLKTFTSRLFNELFTLIGSSPLCTPFLLDGPTARHKCERSLVPARETTISWVQLPSSRCVSRDFVVLPRFLCKSAGTDGGSSKQPRRYHV